MKFSLPSFLNFDIYKKMEKVSRPFFMLLILAGVVIRALQFGKYNNDYDILYSLYGAFLNEFILFAVFFMMKGRRFSQLARLQIFYLAFVPNLTYAYMKRITDFKIAFELREDVVKGKWPAAVALWYPDVSRVLQLMIPFIVLLILAIQMNRDKIKKVFEKWYWGIGIAAVVLILFTLPFANLMNIVMYLVRLGLVCVIWNLWEKIRLNKSLEPAAMVCWAEILLFFVLWLKGLVENLGYLA